MVKVSAAVSLLLGAFALPAASAEKVRLEMDVMPIRLADTESTWTSVDAIPTEDISLDVHLKHSEEQKTALNEALMAVSDPSSPLYGKHLTDADLKDILGQTPETLFKVASWMAEHGITEEMFTLNAHHDVIHLNTKVDIVETLLSTDIVAFSHITEDVRVLRSFEGYHVPEEMVDVISMVGDLVRLPPVKEPVKPIVMEDGKPMFMDGAFLRANAANVGGSGQWANDCEVSQCKGLVTPGVLRTAYNVGNDATSSKNSMAVAEFQYQYYDQKILDSFNEQCHVDSTPSDVIGGNNPSQAGIEALLDIEYIKAIAPEVPLTIWYSSDYSLLKWANAITEMTAAPLVWSVSYGNDEAQQSGSAYMEECSTAFQKAGAKGLSLLFASGDQGACGREGCRLLPTFKKYHPDFPAACPWITAVGGTDFKGNTIGEESAWSVSGGGFSNEFDIPDWQAEAVATYKSTANLPRASYFSDTGRGYPDVAALGGEKNTYCVATSTRSFQGVAGTSASCPVVGGIIAKLNGIRLAAGKSPLGFLNPLLYKHGNTDAYNDVVTGNNGFDAAPGWDPTTGWGSMNYEKWAEIVRALP